MPIGFGSSNLAGAAGSVVKNFGNKLKSDRGEGKVGNLPDGAQKFNRRDDIFDADTILRYPIDLGNEYNKYAIKFDIFLQTSAKIEVPPPGSDAKKEADKEAGAKDQGEDTKLQKIDEKKKTKEQLSDELRDIELKYLKIKNYSDDPAKGFWAKGYKVGESSNKGAWDEFEGGGGTKKFGGKLTSGELQEIKGIRVNYKEKEKEYENADSDQKNLGAEKNESKKRKKDQDFDQNAMTLRRDSVFKHESAIALYFPAKITNNTTATYQDIDVSNYTTAAASSVMGNINALFSGGKVDLSSIKNMIGSFEALVQDQIEQALPGFRETGEILSGKGIRADRMEVAFKGVGRRAFSFDFKFMPKSKEESEEVRKIIQRFRTYQMPSLSTSRLANIKPKDKKTDVKTEQTNVNRDEQLSGVSSDPDKKSKPKTDGKIYYDSPGFFDISFMIQANENDYPIKMGRSVLESVNVSYGGARTSFFKNEPKEGRAAPTEITMSLSFKEVETLHRDRVKEGY